jgi:multicomponent Na+:H+ antiporter subunit F
MTKLSEFVPYFLMTCCIILALCAIAALIRAIKGPRYTDRLVAGNMIGTMVIATMCILSVYLGQSFLVDVAIVYALLSALAVIVLSRLIIVRRYEQIDKEGGQPVLDDWRQEQ